MFVLFHVNYGYLSELNLDESGLTIAFESDPFLAIQFEDKSQWYAVLSFFACQYSGSDRSDHYFFEIHSFI